MTHTKLALQKTPSLLAAVEVVESPSRCPYCHDDARSPGSSVACEACLARHHAECWRELSACASCGGRACLVPAAAPPVLDVSARTRVLRRYSTPQLTLDLRGRQAHFEGTDDGLLAIAPHDATVQPIALLIRNDTDVEQRVALRQLPAWLVPTEGPEQVIPAGGEGRFLLDCVLELAPRRLDQRARPGALRAGLWSLTYSGLSSASLIVSGEDDARTVEVQVVRTLGAPALALLCGLLSLVPLLGLILWIISLVEAARPVEGEPRELPVRRREADEVARVAQTMTLCMGAVLLVGVIIGVIASAA
ncbi:MAG: hypothetical protein AB7N76_15825 [Planctomycetota bacterium]